MECITCGNDYSEKFCPVCDEKTFDPKQLSVKEFIEELFDGVVHFDNKFVRTLKVLTTQPGQLAVDDTRARSVTHMKPMQLSLVVNLIFWIT